MLGDQETQPFGSEAAGLEPLRTLGVDELVELRSRLEDRGIETVRGTFVDSAGVLRSKQVPLMHVGSFNARGLGAAESWVVYAVDDEVAMTPSFGAVGDMRLRADLDAIAIVDRDVAWVPIELADQYGAPKATCPRGALRRQIAAAKADGLDVMAAIELEFTCFRADTGLAVGGHAYTITRLMDLAGFVSDVQRAFASAGVEIEQIHAEYGDGQVEIAVAPSPLLRAIDQNVLARVVLGTVARHHGLRISFSPQPHRLGLGNGAHLHMSITEEGQPLFSGGDGPAHLTERGQSLIAGIVEYLPESVAIFAPSLLSGERLRPGHWSGATACWGVENREAAVRLCCATPGNPHGANVEVKCVDPSANPYVVAASLLGLMRRGDASQLSLPPEITVDPQQLAAEDREASDAVTLEANQARALDAMEASEVIAEILGAPLIEALVAVRRHEVEISNGKDVSELISQFRYAWSA